MSVTSHQAVLAPEDTGRASRAGHCSLPPEFFDQPGIFARGALGITPMAYRGMLGVIEAAERVIVKPAYQAEVLARLPVVGLKDHGPRGAVLSYDFHLTPDGPKLIEINTNAGGLLMCRAQTECLLDKVSAPKGAVLAGPDPQKVIDAALRMFLTEWSLQRGERPLRTVAIVDEDPQAQFMYPEFSLYAALLDAAGIKTVIADGRELTFHEGRLWHGETEIDMVYNRLCDFYLERPEHAVLRLALDTGAAVVTPHPRAHALYADKLNFALLGNRTQLTVWGVGEADADVLAAAVPGTAALGAQDPDAVWANRRALFFKPRCGHGSRAVYRGDKLTKRVWSEIVAKDYIVQDNAPASTVVVPGPDGPMEMKLDVRVFTYDGRVMAVAGRLYQGQVTNFRTEGGGLVPVFLRETAPDGGTLLIHEGRSAQ